MAQVPNKVAEVDVSDPSLDILEDLQEIDVLPIEQSLLSLRPDWTFGRTEEKN